MHPTDLDQQYYQHHGSQPNAGRCLVRPNGRRRLHLGRHRGLDPAPDPWNIPGNNLVLRNHRRQSAVRHPPRTRKLLAVGIPSDDMRHPRDRPDFQRRQHLP